MRTSFTFMAKCRYLKFPVFFALALALFGGTVMLLWNWLMPTIFGLTTLSFWQALGLFILARLLFSSMGFGGRRGSCNRRHFGRHTNEMREKWMTLSFSERREWFKKRGFHRGCGFPSRPGFDSFSTKEENDTPRNE